MGNLLITIIINLTEYMILILLMQYVCSAHMNLCRRNLLLCCGMAAAVYTPAFLFGNESLLFFSVFALIALTVLLFSRKRLLDLLLFLPAFSIYCVLTVIPESLISELWPALEGKFLLCGTPLRALGIATDLLLLILLLFLRYILEKYETTLHFSFKEIMGSIGLLFFSLIDGLLLVALNRVNLSPVIYYSWEVIFIGALIFCTGYYLFNLIESRVRIYRQALSRNETEYLRLQLEALQDAKEDEEQIKRMRHDLKNHLSVIQTLCEEGSYDEVRRYTGQLNLSLPLSPNDMLTGNKVADFILHSKKETAQKQGIAFTFSGSLSSLDKLEAPEICGLLSNAYDNAIEACLTQEHAYIRTQARTTRNYTVILITNSVTRKVSVQGTSIPTTKKDASSHGYGMEIMKRIARKYGGSCSFHCSQNEFEVKIVLLT